MIVGGQIVSQEVLHVDPRGFGQSVIPGKRCCRIVGIIPAGAALPPVDVDARQDSALDIREKGKTVVAGGGEDGSGGGSGSTGAVTAGLLSDPQPGNQDVPAIRTRSSGTRNSGIEYVRPDNGAVILRLFSN